MCIIYHNVYTAVIGKSPVEEVGFRHFATNVVLIEVKCFCNVLSAWTSENMQRINLFY